MKVNKITCRTWKQAFQFCMYMKQKHNKTCLPIGKQVFFKENNSEPWNLVPVQYYCFKAQQIINM